MDTSWRAKIGKITIALLERFPSLPLSVRDILFAPFSWIYVYCVNNVSNWYSVRANYQKLVEWIFYWVLSIGFWYFTTFIRSKANCFCCCCCCYLGTGLFGAGIAFPQYVVDGGGSQEPWVGFKRSIYQVDLMVESLLGSVGQPTSVFQGLEEKCKL